MGSYYTRYSVNNNEQFETKWDVLKTWLQKTEHNIWLYSTLYITKYVSCLLITRFLDSLYEVIQILNIGSLSNIRSYFFFYLVVCFVNLHVFPLLTYLFTTLCSIPLMSYHEQSVPWQLWTTFTTFLGYLYNSFLQGTSCLSNIYSLVFFQLYSLVILYSNLFTPLKWPGKSSDIP